MKKYMLLVTCSFFVISSANALTANEQLKALKDAYMKNFNEMDANKDGKISKSEYLSYQFEDLRANIIGIDSFDDVDAETDISEDLTSAPTTTPQAENDKSLGAYSKTIAEMASYDMDIDSELSQDLRLVEYEPLTKEDVMPDVVDVKNLEVLKEEPVDELTEKTKEDAELDSLISDTEAQISTLSEDNLSPSKDEKEDKDAVAVEELPELSDDIKTETTEVEEKEDKTDEVTTWTDILYENGIISYIYQADVDISLFSEEEKQILKDSIKSEACEEIFKSVCPQVLPVFIENGTNMTVKYIDKNNKEISFCELNKETCAN